MFSQVRQALDSLAAALDNVDAAPTAELRRALALAKPLRAKLETLETSVASQIARRERHGDGGAGVLHQIAAVPRSDAARNVRVAAELEQLPEAQSALAQGEMSMANAARLARAARHTSPEAVQRDAELVNLAKTLPPDEFAHASQRWTAKHQSAADLAERHRRNRRNRNVRFWNGDDGTVQMRGAFDAEMGARIQARLRDEAERLRRADRRLLRNRAAANPDDAGARHPARNDAAARHPARNGAADDDTVRTRDQRMADALERILTFTGPTAAASASAATNGHKTPDGTANGTVFGGTLLNGVALSGAAPSGAVHEGTAADDEAPDLATPGQPPSNGATSNKGRAALNGAVGDGKVPEGSNDATVFGGAALNGTAHEGTATHDEVLHLAAPGPGRGYPAPNGATPSEHHAVSGDEDSTGRKGSAAEIIVRADLSDLLDECGGTGEIAGTGLVPTSVIDRLSCNADVSIVLCGKKLTPLYEATASRAPTAAQRRALIARDGACIGCGAVPDECEAHHIIPWKRGGPTRIDNLVLVCWHCHDRIHDHNWQVVIGDGRYRLVPPDATSPPNSAPSKKPIQCHNPAPSQEAALSS